MAFTAAVLGPPPSTCTWARVLLDESSFSVSCYDNQMLAESDVPTVEQSHPPHFYYSSGEEGDPPPAWVEDLTNGADQLPPRPAVNDWVVEHLSFYLTPGEPTPFGDLCRLHSSIAKASTTWSPFPSVVPEGRVGDPNFSVVVAGARLPISSITAGVVKLVENCRRIVDLLFPGLDLWEWSANCVGEDSPIVDDYNNPNFSSFHLEDSTNPMFSEKRSEAIISNTRSEHSVLTTFANVS